MIHRNINSEIEYVDLIITNLDQSCRRNDRSFNHEAMMYFPDLLAIAMEYLGVLKALQHSLDTIEIALAPASYTVFEVE